MSTIFAQATAPGKSGVAIIRISGPKAAKALKELTKAKLPPERRVVLRKIYSSAEGELLDEGVVIWFPAPGSFTGEDVAELHIHGSSAGIKSILMALGEIEGLRMAEAGEFSKRAFENDRMDLTQLEGLADLIDAETKLQQKQALRQMEGELVLLYESWRQKLISLLANLEAYIDFPDEDMPESLNQTILQEAEELLAEISAHSNDRRGEIIRNGLQAVILGAPNAGKSSLMNYLAKRDVAIVSNIAGTTRDVIEVQMDIAGFPLSLCDTAGLREASEGIEAEGIKRALARAENADLKIILLDGSAWPKLDDNSIKQIDANSLVILNKTDLIKEKLPASIIIEGRQAIAISIAKKQGLGELMKALETLLFERFSPAISPSYTRERHRQLLAQSATHLEHFIGAKKSSMPIEICAEDLRLSAKFLGNITGKIEIEEILDEIFQNFCIGK